MLSMMCCPSGDWLVTRFVLASLPGLEGISAAMKKLNTLADRSGLRRIAKVAPEVSSPPPVQSCDSRVKALQRGLFAGLPRLHPVVQAPSKRCRTGCARLSITPH